MSNSEIEREQQFVSALHERLDVLRARAQESARGALAQVGNAYQAKLEREVAVSEGSRRLAAINAAEHGLCFGRLDFGDGRTHHIGRMGIQHEELTGEPMLIDWRAEAARPFYLATGHSPMGLRRRRHLTTEGRTVTALHDELMDISDPTRTGHESSDADAVLLAALDAARTGRMHDIVRTIQAEQDRIIRAPHRGVMVVEGGPGTGKTAVALHRAAFLLYEHRELLARRAVLIVGPNPAFLDYIGEVLPSLGETGVLLATPGELFPGVRATGEESPAAAEVKGRPEMADVLAKALRGRQTVPERVREIDHEEYGTLLLHRETAEDARHAARESSLPHNLARPVFAFRIIDELTSQLVERIGADPLGGENLLGPDDIAQLGRDVATSPEVHDAVEELWPQLTPQRFLADYLAEPVHLDEESAELIRREGGPWTEADVPLLDEAAELLGEDDSAARARAEAGRQEEIAYAQGVLEVSAGSQSYEFEDMESEVLAAHDIIDAERMAERQEETDDRSAAERAAGDRTWAFGHIIVDEAQELSAMAWRLLMRRVPTRSMTLVGDPAQTAAPAGVGSWARALRPHVGDRWERVRLRVNYRTPAEIMQVAADVVRAHDPDFTPPESVRWTGVRPWVRSVGAQELAGAVAREAYGRSGRGRTAVIAPQELHAALLVELPDAGSGAQPDLTREVVLLTPRGAKGLEFDSVLVVEPAAYALSDLYVALTRATQRLGVLHTGRLPRGLEEQAGTEGEGRRAG
ncbi:AAA family ATPase [Streptomyces sp. XM4193]|nr:AAA family ATPase [Streptomyces sp. XM4193]MCK1798148.1 AAA family ATPase [Streptomyces sp. XM4193]